MANIEKEVKSFNGTVVGNPTLDLDTGIVSGFGSNAYLTIPNSLGAIGNIFYYHFKTGSTPSSIVRLYTLEGFDAVLLDSSNKFLMYSWSAKTFYNFPVTATENTEYWVRIKTEAGQRVYGASLDGGETYTDLLTIADTTYGPQPSETFYLGRYSGGEYWNGSLYLNDCYVTDSDGVEIWRGIKTSTYYGSTFKVHQTLPYMFGARGVGYYDSVASKVPTSNEDILLTMKAYDGLTETYTEGIGTAGKVDFTGTVLPWKWDYNSGLDVSKYCLMPSGLTYENIKTPDVLGRNFTVVGSPAINDSTGVVSGFSASNYLQLPTAFNSGNNSWEIVIKFKTNSFSSEQKLFQSHLSSSRYGACLGIQTDGHFNFFCSSDGSSWLFDLYGTYNIAANTDYYVKFGWNTTLYYVDISTDNQNYSRDISFSSSSSIYDILTITNFGIYFNNQNKYVNPFLGSIDLSETYININGERWWNPYVSVLYSLPGCTYNFTDDGSAATLNAFAVQGDKNIVLTPDVEYYGNRYLGTVEIPQHSVYQYNNGTWQNAPHLIGGHTYYFKMIGGGGGSSTWDGGAGAYWEGYYTPAQTVAVTLSQGGGGSGAGAYSRRHNGVKGGTTSIVGEGVSIVCEGGQGAIGLRNGDETGNSSTYTYAPTITITNGTYETIKSSTHGRPRRISWNDDTVTGYGAGGQAASGTKAPGNDGLAGYLEYYQVGTITINPTPADALVEMSLDGVEYTTTNSLIAKVGETVYYRVSKEGYITEDTSVLVEGNATINVELIEEPQP